MFSADSSFLDAVPVPTWVSEGGLFVFANAAMRSLLGNLTEPEPAGRAVLEFVAPADREAVESVLRTTACGECGRVEATLETGNGCRTKVELLVQVSVHAGARFETACALSQPPELDRLHRKLQTVLDVAPVGLAVAEEPECHTIHVNRYIEKLLKLPRRLNISVTGPQRHMIPYSILSHGESVPVDEMPMQKAARENREVLAVEHDLLLAGGDSVSILSWAAPLHDETGRVCGSVGAFLDVTASKQAEERLYQQASRLESQTRLLSLAPVLILGPDGTITFWSGGAQRLYGFTAVEAVGRRADELLETAFPEPPEQIQEQVLRDGAWSGELVRRTADGRRITVASELVAHRDGDGQAVAILESSTDISALKAARDKLRKTQEHLKLAHRAARIGAWDWDPRADEFTFHEGTLEVFDLQPGEVVTLADFVALVHPDDREHLMRQVRWTLAEASEGRVEFRYLRGDRVRWLQALAAVHRDHTGQPILLTGLSIDITEQKQSEAALRQKQKLESIGLLAGGIAHDFNNLLSAILGASTLVSEMLESDHPASHMLELIDTSCERASDLTRQLLSYAGKSQVRPVRVNVTQMGRQACELVTASLPPRVSLEFETEAGLPCVQADPGQIQQVLMNLLLNGAEAMGDRGGRLQVRLATVELPGDHEEANLAGDPLPPGKYVSLEVTDTGCGMEPATIARIFDPFFSTKFTGRGLGLAAVHGAVRGLRGSIHVTSVPGRGSSFRVLLPAVQGAAPERAERAAPAAKRTEGVLVVDDDDSVRKALAGLLESRGHEVVQAGSGREAIEILGTRGDRVDVVLLDLGMPRMSGAETLERIRAIRAGIPVILISGYGEQEILDRLQGQTVCAALRKPCLPRDLFQAVDQALDQASKAK